MVLLALGILIAPLLFFAWIDRAGGINGPGK
jgi:hypothetical protein